MDRFIESFFPKEPPRKSSAIFQNYGTVLFVGFGLLVLISYLLTKNVNRQSALTATAFQDTVH